MFFSRSLQRRFYQPAPGPLPRLPSLLAGGQTERLRTYTVDGETNKLAIIKTPATKPS
jgi:hypothetical protein